MERDARARPPGRTNAGKLPVSVFVLTRDEEDRLPDCLASVGWAGEVVVVDSGSRDATTEIARRFGARVVTHPWEGFAGQKRFAIRQCRHPWAFWLDADERVSPELEASLRELFHAGPRAAGYEVCRRTVYLGRALRFGGWYPEWRLRLFRRDRVEFPERLVHETAVVSGPVGRLRGDLWHHPYRSLSDHLRKVDAYSSLWARQEAPHRRAHWWSLLLHPPAKFLKSYVLRLGFLEGWRGLLMATMGAVYVAMKYAKLWETQRSGPSGEGRRVETGRNGKPPLEEEDGGET
jgi:glycosyltransferase involved in cell wall biosynthesis